MSPAVPFVVLFQGRTGSTFFVEALDSHPEVRCGYEELASDRWDEDGAAAQLELVRWLLRPPHDRLVRAVGFKTKLRDVRDADGFAGVLAELGVRVIHLKRRNLVKLTVSSLNSERAREHTGDWNLYRRDPAVDAPLPIEPEAFLARLAKHEGYEAALDRFVLAAGRPTLTLHYEDLLVAQRETLALAFGFLGVGTIETSGRTVKMTGDDLRTVLPNFDELRDSVGDPRYRRMFDEVLVSP